MSDETAASVPEAAASAGSMLRRAREAAGLELDTLSATIKVSLRKLEALEADRYDQMPDAVFTRALALTVCRALKIDAAPVLALLPAAKEAQGLEHVTQGLNQPFDERGGAVVRMLSGGWVGLLRPGVLAPLCLVGGALALYLWPHRPQLNVETPAPVVAASAPQAVELAASEGTLTSVVDRDLQANAPPPHASEPPDVSPNAGEFPPAASAPVAPVANASSARAQVAQASAAARQAASATAASIPASAQAARQPAPPSPSNVASAAAPVLAGGDAVALKAKEDSWIDVRDAKGHVLVSRLVRAGEVLGLSGVAPMQVKIGNARGTELQFRGRPVDLSAARDNVARMELK